MKKYSKCAVYALEEFTNKEGQRFYDATLVENTYNPKIPYANKWEMTFYKCQIYEDIDLEVANFDLGVTKNPVSFENISNPAHSVIRVLDFEYVNRTQWKGQSQVKNDMGKAKVKQYIAISKCVYDAPQFKSEERQIADIEKRLEVQKQNNIELRKKIKQLEKELAKRDEEILDKNEKLNNIQIGYNPKWKESKALPTKDDMVEFEDI